MRGQHKAGRQGKSVQEYIQHLVDRNLGGLGGELADIIRSVAGGNADDNNFTVTGGKSIGADLEPAAFMDLCLAENDRRLGDYDTRLLRPATMPWLVRLARRTFLRSKHTPVSASGSPG